jgi:hypothetical protein
MRVLFLKKEPREKIRLFLMAASGVRLNIFLKNRKLIVLYEISLIPKENYTLEFNRLWSTRLK